jgi:hypothetical protein
VLHWPVSLQSLIIQAGALMLSLAGFLLLAFLGVVPAIGLAVLVQAVLAAGLSRMLAQPAWWWGLHAGFLPAVWGALHAALPAWAYLLVFLSLLLFYWSSFYTRVPLFLSGRHVWDRVEACLPPRPGRRFIDLGSGLGGLPLYLAARDPDGGYAGTEIAPAPWLISRLRAWLVRSRAVFLRRDYTTLNLADYDVIFAYLSPAAMPALWQQAESQMRAGCLFLSLAFDQGMPPADETHVLPTGQRLLVWRMPGADKTLPWHQVLPAGAEFSP